MTMLVLFIFLTAILTGANCCFFECQRDGNFANPNEKHSYIQCIRGTAYLQHCPKAGDGSGLQIFNGQQCIEPFVCPLLNGKFRHSYNDGLYYVCTNGVPYVQKCDPGLMFDGMDGCIESFICPKLSGLFVNLLNKAQYYDCCYGRPTLKTCPFSHQFDESIQRCVDVFICPQPNGRFRNVKNDRSYYWCTNDVARLIECPPGYIFDGIQNCYEPYRCPKPNGLFSYPHNSSQYYRCRYDQATLEHCPPRTIFDAALESCLEVFICPNPNGVFEDPKNRNQYYWCYNNRAVLQYCPNGHEFDGISRCRKIDICPTPNRLTPNPRNASEYYQCSDNRYVRMSCPCDSLFDERQQRCVPNTIYTCNPNHCENPIHHCPHQPCPRRHCPQTRVYDGERCVRPYRCPHEDGVYRNDWNDRQYYVCRNRRPSLNTCPNNYMFDDRRECCVSDASDARIHWNDIRDGIRETNHNGMKVRDQWDPNTQQWIRTYVPINDNSGVIPVGIDRNYVIDRSQPQYLEVSDPYIARQPPLALSQTSAGARVDDDSDEDSDEDNGNDINPE